VPGAIGRLSTARLSSPVSDSRSAAGQDPAEAAGGRRGRAYGVQRRLANP
jgi:hypothetical protein